MSRVVLVRRHGAAQSQVDDAVVAERGQLAAKCVLHSSRREGDAFPVKAQVAGFNLPGPDALVVRQLNYEALPGAVAVDVRLHMGSGVEYAPGSRVAVRERRERDVGVSYEPDVNRYCLKLCARHEKIQPLAVYRLALNCAVGDPDLEHRGVYFRFLYPAEVVLPGSGMHGRAESGVEHNVIISGNHAVRPVLFEQHDVVRSLRAVGKVLPQLCVRTVIIVVSGQDGDRAVEARERVHNGLDIALGNAAEPLE